jgi:hypothetical protein
MIRYPYHYSGHSPNLIEHNVADATIGCLDVKEAEAMVFGGLLYVVDVRQMKHFVFYFFSVLIPARCA